MTPPAELIDIGSITRYLDEILGPGDEVEVERHQAGHSNETFFIRRGDQELVLRRPPLGAFLPSAHDVAREYRVMAALQGSSVRVPTTIATCTDESVIGAPFYLMGKVPGHVIRDELPDTFTVEHRASIGPELVDALVELHAVDPASVGLEDFGRPSGYLERQLRRWKGQMELTLPLTRPLADLEAVGEWLAAELPDSPPSTLVHGDYKLDNVMFAPDVPPRLNAI